MNDDELYEQIAKHQYKYNYTSPWEHLAPTPRKILAQAARNTMEPILARVRRDAAREALDGLYEDASQEYRIGLQGDDQERMDAAEAVLRATYAWMDNYPEESA